MRKSITTFIFYFTLFIIIYKREGGYYVKAT